MTKTLLLDLETDGLLHKVTRVHCGVVYNLEEDKYLQFTCRPVPGSDGTIEDMLDYIKDATKVIGHNIVKFDLPVLTKLYNYTNTAEVEDTLLLAKLVWPAIKEADIKLKLPGKYIGRHSLEAWGIRLNLHKGDFGKHVDAWDVFTEDMLSYCVRDVQVLVKLYKHLKKNSGSNWPNPKTLKLEHDFAAIIGLQEQHGVYFDLPKAQQLHVELIAQKEHLEGTLREVFKPLSTWYPRNYPKAPFKKDGEKSAVLLNQEAKGYHFNDKGEYGFFEKLEFNPSSRQHIVRWLKEVYGWKPKVFTDKDTPIVDESVLSELDFEEAKILCEYFKVNKILGMLAEGRGAWLKLIDDDQRIRGNVDTLGTVTRRCGHSKPNMAQTPSSRAYKGTECRQLFCAPKGKRFVSADADGLELRILAHYMARYDAGIYGETVHSGKKEDLTDIHNVNMRAAGLDNRDQAKTFIYGFLYGAGAEKIGQIVGGTASDGQKLKDKFLKSTPALKKLIDDIQKAVKDKGYINCIDGHPLHVRSAHSALNTLLQSGGSITVKAWTNIAYEVLSSKYKWGEQIKQVLHIQDEVNYEVDEDIAEDVAKILEEVASQVTEMFNLRCPFVANAAIGYSWEIH